MGLPFSLPPYIKGGRRSVNKAFEIKTFGLSTEGLGGMLVDEKYWLEGYEASSSFYLIPVEPKEEVPFPRASFYADCLAFEHELPALAIPNLNKIPRTDIPWLLRENRASEELAEIYIDYLTSGAEAGMTVSNGLWCDVIFRYDWLEYEYAEHDGFDIVKIPWGEKYGKVASAIHLYNTALRQTDPLSQYLCFYRVIENIAQDEYGTRWIKSKIAAAQYNKNFNYLNPIYVEAIDIDLIPRGLKQYIRNKYLVNQKGNINLTEVMRASAIYRLRELRKELNDNGITKRLYNKDRCKIAHGKRIKMHNIGESFWELLKDLKLIRYLARLIIEEKQILK